MSCFKCKKEENNGHIGRFCTIPIIHDLPCKVLAKSALLKFQKYFFANPTNRFAAGVSISFGGVAIPISMDCAGSSGNISTSPLPQSGCPIA